MKRDNESRTVITRNYQLIWYASQGRSVAYPTNVEPKPFAAHRRRAATKNRARPFFQLFDLEEDPGQLNNVADEYPETVERLRQKLRGWMRRMNDPLLKGPTPKPYYNRAVDQLKQSEGQGHPLNRW
jgi:hypothetical protein